MSLEMYSFQICKAISINQSQNIPTPNSWECFSGWQKEPDPTYNSQQTGCHNLFGVRPTITGAQLFHILSYLNTTKPLWLCLGSKPWQSLHGFLDADWASTTKDRRSTTGWVFKYVRGPVSWKSRRQPTVASSTTEGGYMAISDASKEVWWLKGIMEYLGCEEELQELLALWFFMIPFLFLSSLTWWFTRLEVWSLS